MAAPFQTVSLVTTVPPSQLAQPAHGAHARVPVKAPGMYASAHATNSAVGKTAFVPVTTSTAAASTTAVVIVNERKKKAVVVTSAAARPAILIPAVGQSSVAHGHTVTFLSAHPATTGHVTPGSGNRFH